MPLGQACPISSLGLSICGQTLEHMARHAKQPLLGFVCPYPPGVPRSVLELIDIAPIATCHLPLPYHVDPVKKPRDCIFAEGWGEHDLG